jgi:hypothetical protein
MKYLVWLPNTPRQDPHVIEADSWRWNENSNGNGSRTTFSVNGDKVGIIVGDCAVFEAATEEGEPA